VSARRAIKDERLLERICELHAANYYAYGYRCTCKALLRAGEHVGRDRVGRLMRTTASRAPSAAASPGARLGRTLRPAGARIWWGATSPRRRRTGCGPRISATGNRGSPRPGWQGGRYTWMRNVLATDHGGGLYRRRKTMVEPVFAQTKHNRRIDRFQRRGRSAVRSEWRLITATHNLLRLHKHQIAAAGA
jgi:Transposase DDE domain/HTH-like domain